MGHNTLGKNFCLTIFGGSHSKVVGGIIEGCPQGIKIDMDLINDELLRRKPSNKYSTQRIEQDEVIFLSGLKNNTTLSSNITFYIENKDVKQEDYTKNLNLFRPSHCDYVYYLKYGQDNLLLKDMASARNTAIMVVGGSIAKMCLKQYGVKISSNIESIGGFDYEKEQDEIKKLLEDVYNEGDSVGGKIRCEIKNTVKGLGEPLFDKFSAVLAKNIFSIPSVCGFEIGDGFKRTEKKGSEDLDNWNNDFSTTSNHCGGINAGITNGMSLVFHVGFRPIGTISQKMKLISKDGVIEEREFGGRHDKCQIFRSGVIVESVAAMTMMDMILTNKTNK